MQAAMPIAAAGAIVKGIGGYQTGKYNQAVANRNALNQERDASAEALRVRQDVRQHIGGQIASQGADGFQLGTGSNFDSLMESQIEGMLDVLNVQRRGATAAASSRAQAKLSGMEAKNSLIGGAFGAASALSNGKANYAAAKG